MITDLWIENFKGIGKRQHIPLRPITLLFGANSAGKSTILHALLYLRECLCSKNPDPRKPLEGKHSVNLGGFANAIHDLNRNSLSIAATVNGGGVDINLGYYLTMNQLHSCDSHMFEPLRIDQHRRGYTSTGISFNAWEPASTIDVTVQHGYMSQLRIAFYGSPGVAIWHDPVQGFEESFQREAELTHLVFTPVIAWINPWCGFLTPENYEAMELGLTSDEAHSLIKKKGAEKRIEFLDSLQECLESMHSRYHSSTIVMKDDWLVSFAILDLPLEARELGQYLPLPSSGAIVPLDSFLKSIAQFTGVRATATQQIDSSGYLVLLMKSETRTEGQRFWPQALICSKKRSTTQICDAIGVVRFACTNDPLCHAIGLSGTRTVVPDLTQPLNFSVPYVPDNSESGLCYLSERQAIIDELVRGGLSSLTYSLDSLTYVGPKRSTVPRNLNSDVMDEFSSWGDGLGAWRWLLKCSDTEVTSCSSWLSEKDIGLGTGIALERTEVLEVPGDVLREIQKGHSFELFLDPAGGSESDALYEDWVSPRKFAKIILRDKRSRKRRHPQDVGEGITQVIPVIAACVRMSGTVGLVAIEQPELHLHPSLAAKLGDLFVTTILSNRSVIAPNTLIETHSEHLILRILRRIRQTTDGELPEHIPPVKPDDVCVLWVDNLGDGTTIQRLRIDERGEFIDRWPQGFFSERAEELF